MHALTDTYRINKNAIPLRFLRSTCFQIIFFAFSLSFTQQTDYHTKYSGIQTSRYREKTEYLRSQRTAFLSIIKEIDLFIDRRKTMYDEEESFYQGKM
jgi:hypothetical protein